MKHKFNLKSLAIDVLFALVGSFILLGGFFDLTLTGADAYWLLIGVILTTVAVFFGVSKMFSPKR